MCASPLSALMSRFVFVLIYMCVHSDRPSKSLCTQYFINRLIWTKFCKFTILRSKGQRSRSRPDMTRRGRLPVKFYLYFVLCHVASLICGAAYNTDGTESVEVTRDLSRMSLRCGVWSCIYDYNRDGTVSVGRS